MTELKLRGSAGKVLFRVVIATAMLGITGCKGQEAREEAKENVDLFFSRILHQEDEELRQMLSKDPTLANVVHADNGPALHFAIAHGSEKAVEMLLNCNASIEKKDRHGNMPLHVAADEGKSSVVALLLKKDAKVDVTGEYEKAPLHLACMSGDINSIKLLLEKKAAVDAREKDGLTPLHRTARNGIKNQSDVVILLIKAGADINAKSKDGETPLSLANKDGKKELVKLLKENGAK